jgi:hypothetical protein
MANRHRQCVSGIVGRRYLIQVKQQLDHLLDLPFVGVPIADNRPFDLRGGVLDHLATSLDRGEHGHTAGMTELQRTPRVNRMEDILNCHALGAAIRQQNGEFSMDAGEALGKGRRAGGDRTTRNESMASSIGLHATIAGAYGARIDAEYSHASDASISFSSMSWFAQTCCTSS